MTDTIGLLAIMILLIAGATYFAPMIKTRHGRIPRQIAFRAFLPSSAFILVGTVGHELGFSISAYTTMWVLAIFVLCLAPPISVVLWAAKKKANP